MRITDWFLVIPYRPRDRAGVDPRPVAGHHHLRHRHHVVAGTARIVRAQVLSVQERRTSSGPERWARATGTSITRHILPNVIPVIFANTILTVADGDPLRDHALVPRPGRPAHVSWGTILENAFAAGATSLGVLVVAGPARRGDRPRRAGVHDVRVRAGRDPQPEAANDERPLRSATCAWRTTTRRGGARGPRGDFDIERGEVLGLAGESGCGKSTIAGAILRLLPAGHQVDGRHRAADGEDVLAMKPGRLRAVRWTEASIVFQGAMHALNPVQPDRGADRGGDHHPPHDRATKEATARVGDLLEQVGLPARRIDDYPHELSGGQKQRVMIAMALACDPSLIIADEPTTALDVMVQAQVLQLLKALQRELGLAMLFITHDLSVLVEVSDRLAIMYAGKIVEEGPARRSSATPSTRTRRRSRRAFPAIGDQRFRRAPSGLAGDPPDPADHPVRVLRSTRAAPRRSTSAPAPSPSCPRRRGTPGCMPAAAPASQPALPETSRDRRRRTDRRRPRRTDARPRGPRPPRELRGTRRARSGLAGKKATVARAVDGVDLALAPARCWRWPASPGCGKTTLARTIMGLVKPDAGADPFRGRARSPKTCAEYRRKVQIVFQDPTGALNPRQTIYESVAEGLRIHKVRGERGAAGRARALASRAAAARALLPALPARAVGRPAPAGRDRRRPGAGPRGHRRRRAGLEPGRVGPRRDPAAAARAARRAADRDADRHARPRASPGPSPTASR